MIYLFDQQSLYPNCFIGANLFSPTDDPNGWNGSGIFPNQYINDEDGIVGTYSKAQGKIEQVIKDALLKRISIPKNDPRNLAYKIFINTIYGISGNPKFVSVYNLTTASDCTALARRCIKFARRMFQNNGYECIYTDTDSIFVKDTKNNEQEILSLANTISDFQRKSFNIQHETHKLKLDCKIKRMYFFRDNKGLFIKKHYIYVKDDDEIVIKGMQLIKGTASPLSKKIFDEVIKPKILAGQSIIFSFEELKQITQEYAKQNVDLLIKRYRVNKPETYKTTEGKEEATGIQYQIAKRYGQGEHWLIVNSKIGPGKGNHYCKLEELKEKYGDEWINLIKLDNYIGDLREFINFKERKI